MRANLLLLSLLSCFPVRYYFSVFESLIALVISRILTCMLFGWYFSMSRRIGLHCIGVFARVFSICAALSCVVAKLTHAWHFACVFGL